MFFGIVFKFVLLLTATITISSAQQARVLTGLDNIDEYADWFANKQVGVICNHTALNSEGVYIVDVFKKMNNVQISALFGPEHGIKGEHDAGEKVDSEKEKTTPVYSLYGKVRKPTPRMLAGTDILVFDIQDIGARFYTYIWTMALAMEAAAEQGIPFVVLDRPNPINGHTLEGNILEKKFASFVGLFPIPVRHGMTIAELAMLFNGEGWLKNGIKADLKIIPLKGWQRGQWFDQTGLKFIKPSPNMPDLATAIVYPGLCLLEGTSVSEGRGTKQPFLQFGAPWIKAEEFSASLNALNLAGVRFTAHQFIPHSIKGMSSNPKYEGKTCSGVKILVTDRNAFRSCKTGIKIVETLHRLYADSLLWRAGHFDRLCGSDKIRETVIRGGDVDSLMNSWQKELKHFKKMRKKYLLY